MSWKCPECEEINSDNNLIRCYCGYEYIDGHETNDDKTVYQKEEIDTQEDTDIGPLFFKVVKLWVLFYNIAGVILLTVLMIGEGGIGEGTVFFILYFILFAIISIAGLSIIFFIINIFNSVMQNKSKGN